LRLIPQLSHIPSRLEKRFTHRAKADVWQVALQVEGVTTAAKNAPQSTFTFRAIDLVTFAVSMKIEGTMFL
jgi:hypothetical protein